MKLIAILGGIVVVGLVAFMSLMGSRNDLVKSREGVTGAWASVEVALQRRADLIPNLVETVKGFAKQEQSIIDSVTTARAALGGARNPGEKIAANDQLSGALSRLLVVMENYPQIKSDVFAALAREYQIHNLMLPGGKDVQTGCGGVAALGTLINASQICVKGFT